MTIKLALFLTLWKQCQSNHSAATYILVDGICGCHAVVINRSC